MHLGVHANSSIIPISNVAYLKPHQARQAACHVHWAQPALQHKASWLHMPSAHAHEVAARAAALEQAHSSADGDTDDEFHCFATLDLDPVAEGEYCMPGEVTVDNRSNPQFTILSIEVKDYPGLLRVVAWVINGLELLVENARLQTDKEGIARNTFWLADYRGRKLPDDKAELVAERVADFVVYCTPSDDSVKAQRFCSGPITVDNKEHKDFTVVTVSGESGFQRRQGFLLEIASALTGLGVSIHEAVIQGCSSCGGPEMVSDQHHDFGSKGRIFKFWVTDRQAQKLDYSRSSSLLYTLALLIGKSNMPLRPPGSNLTVQDGTAVESF